MTALVSRKTAQVFPPWIEEHLLNHPVNQASRQTYKERKGITAPKRKQNQYLKKTKYNKPTRWQFG